MFLDLEDLERGTELRCDVVIVGAGPAGITLARELASTFERVLLLEAGGENPGSEPDLSDELDLSGHAPSTVHDGRARALGGASTLWAGQVMPLNEMDFRARPWVRHSGWPFPRSTLDPFYRRAEELLGLPRTSFEAAGWPPASPRPPEFGPDLAFRFSRFTRTVDFARAFGPGMRASTGLDVVLHAAAARIVVSPDRSRVEHVDLVSPGGNTARARGAAYVLCCGAIETARLLLASDIGTDGLVGRFFQEHMHLKLRLAPFHRRRTEAIFNSRPVRGRSDGGHRRARPVRTFPKVVANELWQERQGLLQVGADVCYATDRSPVVAGKAVLRALRSERREVPGAVATMAARTPEMLAMGWRTLRTGAKPSEGTGDMYLSIQCENAPSPDNRVTLFGPGGDGGVPKAVLHWEVDDLEVETITRFTDTLTSALERTGIAIVQRPREWPLGTEALARCIDVGHHHMGTARMHDNPSQGVVDRDCRLHAMENLYVGGAAVFPTGGFSNPTLTILALCIRLADHLKSGVA